MNDRYTIGMLIILALVCLLAPALAFGTASKELMGKFVREQCLVVAGDKPTADARRVCIRAGQRARKMTLRGEQATGKKANGEIRASQCPFLAGTIEPQIALACYELKVKDLLCRTTVAETYPKAMAACRTMTADGPFRAPLLVDRESEEDPKQPLEDDFPHYARGQ